MYSVQMSSTIRGTDYRVIRNTAPFYAGSSPAFTVDMLISANCKLTPYECRIREAAKKKFFS